MFMKRSFALLAVLALMGGAALTISAAIATSTVVSNGGSAVTEHQRIESLTGSDPQVSPLRRNIHERAWERADANAGNTVNTSTSPLRRNIHERAWERTDANASGSSVQPDLSDYAVRHPELMRPATPDLSDWYLRHKGEFSK